MLLLRRAEHCSEQFVAMEPGRACRVWGRGFMRVMRDSLALAEMGRKPNPTAMYRL